MLTGEMTLDVSLSDGGSRRVKLVDSDSPDAVAFLVIQESDGDYWRTVERKAVDRIDIKQGKSGGMTSRDGEVEVYSGP